MSNFVPDMTHLKADEAPEPIWEAVGHALSNWEVVEINQAVLFCGFKGIPRTIVALTAYGNEGTVYSRRIGKLEKAAEAYFVANPHQDWEGEFRAMVAQSNELSTFRHRIAHEIVTKKREFGFWWLAPPWYTEKLHYEGEPYFYCSGQVRSLAAQFSALAERVKFLRQLLMPQ